MTPQAAIFAGILSCVAGAAITLPLGRRRELAGAVAFAATAVSAGLVGLAAAGSGGDYPNLLRGWLAAGGAGQRLQVDGLSAIFLLVAAAVAVPASFYSIRYLRHYEGSVARYYPYFLLLLAATYGLLSTADTGWWLLLFWQLMVFSGYGLLRFDRGSGTQGGNRFVIMLELGCGAILAATGLLEGGGGGATWSALEARLPAMIHTAPGESTLAFVLLLLGFGITLGMWPFGQMWLPHASRGAPAPVSALLCGVVIKLGVYGLIRSLLMAAPAAASFPVASWGVVLAVLGTITLFVGTMQALQQEHGKRLLAFHSIGQMGYILLALGTCLALLRAPGAAGLAWFALMAGLFHVVNHSLFSTLLYFNAGSVLQATGTQDLNRLGGLMKHMPLTGMTALVGALAISGVPLLNGFASKWAIFAAAIQGAGWAKYLALCAAVAILTSGVTLASFIKFFGATFLARESELVKEKAGLRPALHGAEPRAHTGRADAGGAEPRAHTGRADAGGVEPRAHTGRADAGGAEPRAHILEVGWSMQAPQVVLAFTCVLLGLAPGLAFGLLQRALAATPQLAGGIPAGAPLVSPGMLGGVMAPQGAAVFVPAALVAILGGSLLLAYGISRLGAAPRRVAEPWLCGYARETERERYVAHNFYGELKRPFRWLAGEERATAAALKGRPS